MTPSNTGHPAAFPLFKVCTYDIQQYPFYARRSAYMLRNRFIHLHLSRHPHGHCLPSQDCVQLDAHTEHIHKSLRLVAFTFFYNAFGWP